MNFFERQSHARRKTRILLLYFVPAVVLIVLAVCFAVAVIFSLKDVISHGPFHTPILPYVAGATLLIIMGGSLFKMRELSEGGRAMAVMLGGSPVNPQTADSEERLLLNIVEEMAIASGVPVPQVFVLREEQGINSFAAGFTPGDTAIGVTQGALKLLSRDELQGIIAHEFSHILNGDAHLNLWMIGLLHGILSISVLGKIIVGTNSDEDDSSYRFFRSKPRDGRGVIFGALLVIVGSIGHFFGSLIKSAVCRKREELADASAVQFTRNPLAIAGALKKIGGLTWGSRIVAAGSGEANHIFFGDSLAEPWFALLQTHPPLRERILLLDPQFDGNFPRVLSWAARQRVEQPAVQQAPAPDAFRNVLATAAATGIFTAPSPRHLAYAAGLQASFDPQIAAAAREPFGACALVFAVLLSSDEPARQQQLTEAGPLANPGLLRQAQEYFVLTDPMSCGQKLALFNIALTGLRQMSGEQFKAFCKVARTLIESDRKVSLFEYTLHRSLRRNLASYFQKKRPIVQFYALHGLRAECAILLSALARHGSDDPQEIDLAFQAGARLIASSTGPIGLVDWNQCNLPQIDAALDKLSQSAMPIKKQIIEACAAAVACDGMVHESEAQLLRAIAEALDSPLPPLLSELGSSTPEPLKPA